MKTRKPLSILLTLALVLGLLPWTVMPARADGEEISGLTYNEAGGYYEISDAQDLVDLAAYVNAGNNASGKTFKQTADIDMSVVGNFTPIGSTIANTFSGTYDGDNKVIANLTINSDVLYKGLFGYPIASTVRNVCLVSPSITSTKTNGSVGPLVAFAAAYGNEPDNNIQNCRVVNPTLNVSNARYCGAVIGMANYATVTNCYFYDADTEHNYTAIGHIDGKNVTNYGRVYAITATGCTATATPTVTVGTTGYYNEGSTVILTATPDEGYMLSELTVTGASGAVETSGTGNTRTFTMPAEDVTVAAFTQPPVAQIGDNYYTTLAEAFGAANNGATVTLLADVKTDTSLTVAAGKGFTLDLNGHTIDRGLADVNNMNDLNGNDGYVLRVDGGLTLRDGSEARTGAITGGNNGTTSVDAAPGGVLVEQGGTLTMNGGAISGNKTVYGSGGGVYVANGGAFKLYGGTISGNNVEGFGGGVCVADGGAFELHGGTISGNSAGSGGGVMVHGAAGAFTMDGGAICGNTAHRGGGVYVEGTFGMSGGSVTGNNCAYYDNYDQGGGVYVEQGGGFAVSGGASVTGNFRGGTRAEDGKYAAGESGAANNVYLQSYLPNMAVVTVADALTKNAGIGVTSGGLSVFTSGWSTYMGEADPAGCFTSDDARYVVMRNDGGEAELRRLYTVTVENGTADKTTAVEGETVTVTANAPATGKVFDRWTTTDDGDVEFADAGKAQTTFTMPWWDVAVAATYKNASYTVTLNTNGGTINNGNVTGYTYGTETTLPTDVTRGGFIFGGWYAKSDLSGSPVTKIAATETGNKTFYAKWTEKNTVTVNSGTGGGSYAEGATVTVTANAPATGKVFDKWTTTDGVTFADAYSAATTFTMPAKAVAVTAAYHDYSLANGKVYAPKGAVLICATYSGGRMTGMQSVTIGADCANADAATLLGAALPASDYKLMLVDGSTFAPLCAAWEG